jgi:5-methylthioadenosine/S-adenosylhomocysteine deaminase
MTTTFDLAVVGGHCLTLDPGSAETYDTLILIRRGKIAWLGEKKDYPERYLAKQTIQASGKLIMPALINAHTHLSLSLYRGLGTDLRLHDWLRKVIWPLEKKFCNPDTVFLGSCLSLLEMIRSGTGTLADMDFFAGSAGKAIEESGLRGFIGEALFSTPSPSISDPRDNINVTEGLIERFRNHPMVHPYVVLHAPFTCSEELYREASALAASAGVKVCSHVAETSDEISQIRERYHMTSIEWLDAAEVLNPDFIAVHAIHLTQHDQEIMAEKGVSVIHNPHSNMMLGSGICPVPELIGRGIRVGLGTDSASSNNSLSMVGELQTAAKLHKLSAMDSSVLPAREAMHLATGANADILGLGKVTGYLGKGMSADLIIVDPSSANMLPLHDAYAQIAYSLESQDIESLVVAGKVIMEKRKILTLDEELILGEVRKWAKSSAVREFISR